MKFCAGDFSLDDAPWSSRPVEVDGNQIKTFIENNQCYTTREIANIFKIPKSSIENHLHQLGYVLFWLHWVLVVFHCIILDLVLWCMDSLIVVLRLSSSVACGILVPWPGIKPVSPALQGGFVTTGEQISNVLTTTTITKKWGDGCISYLYCRWSLYKLTQC